MAELPEWAVDAADIPDHACVLRRVPAVLVEKFWPTTQNFRASDDDAATGLSVTYWQGAEDEHDILRLAPAQGLISLVVADVRSLGLLLVRTPLVGNLNHCELLGSITPAGRKRLKVAARWVRQPATMDPAPFEPFEVHCEHSEPRIPAVT